VRVPKDAKVAVNVAVLSPEHFDKWDSFRNLLLVKTVPMVQMLPRKERQKILQNLSIKDFRDGDYIIRQGDVGTYLCDVTSLIWFLPHRELHPSPYTILTDVLIPTILFCTSPRRGLLHHPRRLCEGR